MNANARRNIEVFSVADDGRKAAFQGTGVRVPVGTDDWVAIDFELNRKVPISVMVGSRCRDRGRSCARLTIHPHAGNLVCVVVGDGCRPTDDPILTLAVSESDLKGDILEWLRKTTSGDPLGETMLVDRKGVQVLGRTFVIEYGNVAVIKVSLTRPSNALLAVDISTSSCSRASPGTPFTDLGMALHVHAANLVSFSFEEETGFVVDEARLFEKSGDV